MADLARLGFATDTNDLTVAEQKLNKLVPAAQKAENAAKRLGTSFVGVGSAASTGSKGTDQFALSAVKASNGTAQFNRSAMMTTTSVNALATSTAGAGAMLGKFSGTTGQATKSLDMLTMSARRAGQTAGQLQANTANIAAQFQDIGVTAQMGMSPLMIGLQQGSQLALVMQQAVGAQGLAGGLRLLGTSLLSVLAPLSLLVIGFVALLAAGLQLIDWTGLMVTSLEFLADHMETIVLASAAVAATLALMYAPQIIAGIATLVVWIGTTLVGAIKAATLALIAFAAANPFAAFIAAMALALTAAYVFRDDIKRIFGVDIIGSVKSAANYVIGSMVGAYNAIRKTWSELPDAIGDAAITAANRVITATNTLVNRVKKELNELFVLRNTETGESRRLFNFDTSGGGFGQIANPFAGARNRVGGVAAGEINAARGQDYIGGAIQGLKDFASGAADWMRGVASGLGAEAGKDDSKGTDKAAKVPKLKASDFKELEKGARAFNKEFSKFTDLFKRSEEAYVSLRDGMLESMSELRTEFAVIGLGTEQTARLRMETKLLNDEKYRNIVYSKERTAELINLAGQEALLTEELRRQQDQIETNRSAFKGFFKDLYSDLRNGENFWKSLGDAITNALDKIADRLIDLWLDDAFQALLGNGKSGGGFFGSIISGIGSLFGGSSTPGTAGGMDLRGFAKGGAFGSDILSSPTMFGYGNGKIGVAGEAGEEAIMPLARGPDGSLGVQMVAGSGGGKQMVELIVRAVEGDMFKPIVSAIADERAVVITQTGIEQYNETLPDRVQEISNDPRAR